MEVEKEREREREKELGQRGGERRKKNGDGILVTSDESPPKGGLGISTTSFSVVEDRKNDKLEFAQLTKFKNYGIRCSLS